MEPGFLQAQSDNLPRIDSFMLMNFIGQNPDFVGIKGGFGRRISDRRTDEEQYLSSILGERFSLT